MARRKNKKLSRLARMWRKIRKMNSIPPKERRKISPRELGEAKF